MTRYARYEFLRVEVADRLATVTLNRPEVRNAMHRAMIYELHSIWTDLADDRAVNAVLLTGAGSYFTVGGDVKAMSERPGGDCVEEGDTYDPAVMRRLVHNMLELDKPVVAAIEGDAIGLGATIALMCDITVIAEQARIGDPHVRVALVAGDGSAVIWPLLVGMHRAKEYLMRGMLLRGTEAERVGLVNYALPQNEVLPKAREIALELAHGATWAIRWTKLALNQILRDRANLVLPSSSALEHTTMEMADHMEATRAFKEKRKPVFTGT
jgi:enoyl-CoA hydratase